MNQSFLSEFQSLAKEWVGIRATIFVCAFLYFLSERRTSREFFRTLQVSSAQPISYFHVSWMVHLVKYFIIRWWYLMQMVPILVFIASRIFPRVGLGSQCISSCILIFDGIGPGYYEKFYFSPGDTGFRCFSTRFGIIGVGICWDQVVG
jgi:hypothetical protein